MHVHLLHNKYLPITKKKKRLSPKRPFGYSFIFYKFS